MRATPALPRPVRRDRYGEQIEDDGQQERESRANAAYWAAHEVAVTYPEQHAEIARAIFDAAQARRRRSDRR